MREFHPADIPRPPLTFTVAHDLPLDLEIGAGQGLHAIRYAQANPGRRLIAVEQTHTRFAALAKRRLNHPELTNLTVLHADAVAFVTHFIPPATLERVFLLYPNPYAKAKVANLRWYNRPFLAQLIKCMKPGAQLTMATNLEWYAQAAREAFTNQW
jgi:tRNA (guanine-N7-)-methyltransferase